MAAASLQSLLPTRDAPPPEHVRKIVKAAQDFESVLLGEMLRSLEKSLSAVPGESNDAGGDDYQYLGTEALASAWAARGGLGIAQTIVHNLMKSQAVGPAASSEIRPSGAKVLARAADQKQ